MEPLPSRIVASEPHGSLEPQGTYAIFLFTDVPCNLQPGLQGITLILKDGAGLQALLPSASGAADILPGGQPPLSISASATLVRRRPAHACEEIYAVVVGGEHLIELGWRPGKGG